MTGYNNEIDDSDQRPYYEFPKRELTEAEKNKINQSFLKLKNPSNPLGFLFLG